MKLFGIIKLEVVYRLRRPWRWLCMAVLALFSFFSTRVASAGIDPYNLLDREESDNIEPVEIATVQPDASTTQKRTTGTQRVVAR